MDVYTEDKAGNVEDYGKPASQMGKRHFLTDDEGSRKTRGLWEDFTHGTWGHS